LLEPDGISSLFLLYRKYQFYLIHLSLLR